MPTISYFFGIQIRMYVGDHPPPHFHVLYQGETFTFSLAGEPLEGNLGRTARRLVQEWASSHQAELVANWERAQRSEFLEKIAPLE